MRQLACNWLYWLRQGHSLGQAWQLAQRTISDNYLCTARRKRAFSFPNFLSKP